MLSLLLALLAPAHAETSVGLDVHAATTGTTAAVSGRWLGDSGLQLGVRAQGSVLREAYLDGWPVTEGRAGALLLEATVPVVQDDDIQLGIEVQTGVEGLQALQTAAPLESSRVLVLDIAPMVTLPVNDSLAARLGFVQLTHLQLAPRSALAGQGSLLRGGLVWAPSDSVQLVADARAGGVFGFDGDGGKFLAQGGAAVRWVPGAARRWTHH